jgi:hypothetical protein
MATNGRSMRALGLGSSQGSKSLIHKGFHLIPRRRKAGVHQSIYQLEGNERSIDLPFTPIPLQFPGLPH